MKIHYKESFFNFEFPVICFFLHKSTFFPPGGASQTFNMDKCLPIPKWLADSTIVWSLWSLTLIFLDIISNQYQL